MEFDVGGLVALALHVLVVLVALCAACALAAPGERLGGAVLELRGVETQFGQLLVGFLHALGL